MPIIRLRIVLAIYAVLILLLVVPAVVWGPQPQAYVITVAVLLLVSTWLVAGGLAGFLAIQAQQTHRKAKPGWQKATLRELAELAQRRSAGTLVWIPVLLLPIGILQLVVPKNGLVRNDDNPSMRQTSARVIRAARTADGNCNILVRYDSDPDVQVRFPVPCARVDSFTRAGTVVIRYSDTNPEAGQLVPPR